MYKNWKTEPRVLRAVLPVSRLDTARTACNGDQPLLWPGDSFYSKNSRGAGTPFRTNPTRGACSGHAPNRTKNIRSVTGNVPHKKKKKKLTKKKSIKNRSGFSPHAPWGTRTE